ncbi:MAG: hypothetical protein WC599_10955, partial [Bacteroidales bacterium]
MNKTLKTNRINEIIEAVIKVARGDYVQLELSGKNDDIDSLAIGLNMMIDDIRKRTMKLDNSRSALLYMLKDIDKTNKELASAKEYTDNIIKSMI